MYAHEALRWLVSSGREWLVAMIIRIATFCPVVSYGLMFSGYALGRSSEKV